MASAEQHGLEELLEFIRSTRGFDYTGYKRPTLQRRIARRLTAVGASDYETYRQHLERNPDEYTELFNSILINVTSFFRDPESWDYLAAEVLPRIVDASSDGIRAWSTGCATGEEAFTLAILLAEQFEGHSIGERVKIYATDVDDDALAAGRHASFTPKQLEPVPRELRERYFEEANGKVAIRGDIRRAVIFGRHDLIHDPPISRIDLLVARNTLMYFLPETQSRILRHFHFALKPRGYLFLGKSELLLSRSKLFTPVDLRHHVFAPAPKIALRERLLDLVHEPSARDPRMPEALSNAGFEAAPVAQLAVDSDGVLVLANLEARRVFGLADTDVGRPLRDLEVSYRPLELRSRIDAVTARGAPVHVRDVELSQGGEVRYLDVLLAPLFAREGERLGVVVTFTDVTEYRSLAQSLETSGRSLETANEELQAVAEELETTNEELQSTNEELETTNEELQSTNEELETMNEELQSTNEELEAINEALRERTQELDEVNAFMEAILSSLHVAVAVLDDELRVQAWNAQAQELWGLRADEVYGHEFLALDLGLPVAELAEPLSRAARDGGQPEDVVVEAVNRRGRPVSCSVGFARLRSTSPGLDGVIVLMEARERGG